MTTRREKAKPQKPQLNKQLETAGADIKQKPQQGVNQRQEKLANFLIDVVIVVVTLTIGLILTNKRKD